MTSESNQEQCGQAITTDTTPSENNAKWLDHPKMQEYAQRYLEGESLEELLAGQQSVEDKRNAIKLLASYLQQGHNEGVGGVEQRPRMVVSNAERQALLAHPKTQEYLARARAAMQTGENISAVLTKLLEGHPMKEKLEVVIGSAFHSDEEMNTADTGESSLAREGSDKDSTSESVLETDLHKVYNDVYFKRRNTLQQDLFLVSHGIDPDAEEATVLYKAVDGNIGRHFDAHGLDKGDQLNLLVALLRNGIDKTRSFYTAPFEVPDDIRAAMAAAVGTAGGTAYKGGLAVVTAGYGESLQKAGIKHVFINDLYKDMLTPLQKRFPNVQVHLLSEQKAVLEGEAREYMAQTPPNMASA